MGRKTIKIDTEWYKVLEEEFSKHYFTELKSFLISEKKKNKQIYPPGNLIFNAFDSTPFSKVKVVIIGQDPYHGPDQAMGLSFSVPMGVKPPPSLKNIFKEIYEDTGIKPPNHGDLSKWASQGVFLLNAVLTVEYKKAGSHRNKGWEQFTDAAISKLSEYKENLVFLLWGNFARGKKELIDDSKHLILESPHPSPLARGGFFGNHHFSKTNEYLIKHKKSPINWDLNN
ncbi:MAG: uracil-DNA glycosylase [Saprospirales bacterium]|nr:MAG: uracil-DNA glycosylase [Saprospirales bacterium]